MRLLEIRATGGFVLTKDYIGNEALPPYAILSHTWWPDGDEVTLQDLMHGTGTGKRGYGKIQFCGKQAQQDGLTHFWVDTCCIDKTNYVELSEAVNSMFKWYVNAKKCYVYLLDVSCPAFVSDAERDRERWIVDFKKSRWFTRGWTLQELLAPKSVDFFSQEGKKIGDKTSLEATVSDITQIPVLALRGRITEFPVEQRISWQQGRCTTREEDEVYSLLGICDVFLPVIYGEGRENAFRRLRTELPSSRIVQSRSLMKLGSSADWFVPSDNQIAEIGDSKTITRGTYARISSYDPLDVLYRIRSKRLERTTEWLSENETFRSWRSSSTIGVRLWFLGKIGSGKTLAIATAVHHLLLKSQQNREMLVLHYFFEYPNTQALDLFRSLAKQLIRSLVDNERYCPGHIVKELNTCFGDRNRCPGVRDVIKTILLPLMNPFWELVVCIDGIEECDYDQQRMIRDGLYEISQNAGVKFLLSGENEMEIRKLSPENSFRIRLDDRASPEEYSSNVKDLMLSDIEKYIETRLDEVSGPDQLFNDTELRQRVTSQLLANCNCMFLWVSLQMDMLETCATPAEVYAVLSDLPGTLKETYVRCILRKRGGKFLCNPTILQWVGAAQEPMTVDQLREMISMDLATGRCAAQNMPSVDSVQRSAVSLLSFEGYERLLIPVHPTVRQFLFSQSLREDIARINTEFDGSKFASSLTDTTLELAQISLLHIEARTGLHIDKNHQLEAPPIQKLIPSGLRRVLGFHQQTATRMRLPPVRRPFREYDGDFLQYAIRTWTAHTREITKQTPFWDLFRRVALQLNASYKIHPWPSVGGTETSHLRGLLGFAVSQNHCPLLQVLTERPILHADVYDHVLPGNELLPALHVAAKAGFVGITRILLGFCKVNAKCPRLLRTALHYAAQNGNSDVVNLLCKVRWAEIDLPDRHGCTPFYLAASEGHTAIVMMLLTNDKVNAHSHTTYTLYSDEVPRVERQNNFGNGSGSGPPPWMALHVAASHGHEATVKTLLESKKIDPNMQWKHGETAFHTAVAFGQDAIVKIFLESERVIISTEDALGRTALDLAVRHDDAAVVKILLDSGKDIGKSSSALDWALNHRNKRMAKILLESEVVTACLTHGWTAFHRAAVLGANEQAKILLNDRKSDLSLIHFPTIRDQRAYINFKDHKGRTALYLAVKWHSSGILRILLESEEVDANLSDHHGHTALHAALRDYHGLGKRSTVEALLQSDRVDVNSADRNGRTALHLAVLFSYQCEPFITLLGCERVDANAVDNDGQTALHKAVLTGSEGIAKALLKSRKVDASIKDNRGRRALELVKKPYTNRMRRLFAEFDADLPR